MDQFERIKVYVKVKDGKIVCICVRRDKCSNCAECEADVVSRDRFRGWESSMRRDKYGR